MFCLKVDSTFLSLCLLGKRGSICLPIAVDLKKKIYGLYGLITPLSIVVTIFVLFFYSFLQESLQDLSQLSATQPLTEDAFEFSSMGELILAGQALDNHVANDVSAASTLSLRPTYVGPGSAISTHSYNIEFQRSLERAAKGICLLSTE